MIAGHAAVALAARARWRRLPIVLLLVATYFPDIAESWLFWTGWPTRNADWGHALILVVPVAVGTAIVYSLARGDVAGGWILGAVVLSHWLLDLVTWVKPTWPHGPVIGLRLYDHAAADFVVEALLVVATWAYVRRRVGGRMAQGRIYAGLVVLQLVADVAGWRQHQMRERENLPAAVPDLSRGIGQPGETPALALLARGDIGRGAARAG